MTRVIAALGAAMLLTLNPGSGSAADEGTGEVDDGTTVYTTIGVNNGTDSSDASNQAGETGTSEATSTEPQLPPGSWVQSVPCETVGAAGCVETYLCPDGSTPTVWTYVLESGVPLTTYSQCPGDQPPNETTTVVDIPGEVVRAFKEVPLPASEITIQPPGGKTLVNLPTIMSTKAQAFTKTVNLKKANVTITLDIVPTNFTWNHGDKTSQSTAEPGGTFAQRSSAAAPMCSTGGDPFPCITHTYVTAENKLGVSVDTTWSATYQVNGSGPWKEVADTVTIVGAAQDLSVLEAKPQLVLN